MDKKDLLPHRSFSHLFVQRIRHVDHGQICATPHYHELPPPNHLRKNSLKGSIDLEACRVLRSDEEAMFLPRIVLTGHPRLLYLDAWSENVFEGGETRYCHAVSGGVNDSGDIDRGRTPGTAIINKSFDIFERELHNECKRRRDWYDVRKDSRSCYTSGGL